MKVFIKATLIPAVAAVIGCILFVLVGLIPQSAIQANAEKSAHQIAFTQNWMPSLLRRVDYQFTDYPMSYLNDNSTDQLILMGAYNLTMTERSSILTNPLRSASGEHATNALLERVADGEPNNWHYVRYWMGFRIFIRPLFLLMSYNSIRIFISVVWFSLFILLVLIISKKINATTALCFGAAMILVNPAIVSHSLQFSCVFLLTFLFSIYICLRGCRKTHVAYLFCLFGVLTQFFDFYTTPIMTWAFPLMFLLLTDRENSHSLPTAAKSLAYWGYGYGLMWIAKLTLVTLLTSINGFYDGFRSFLVRTSVISDGNEPRTLPSEALQSVWNTVFPGTLGRLVLLAGIVLLVAAAAMFAFRRGREVLKRNVLLLGIACVPLLWYCAAAQPTVIHAWFQYRSISIVLFAAFVFIANAFVPCVKFLKEERTSWTG